MAIPVIVTDLAITYFGNVSLGVVTGLLTLVLLVFCEVIPKQLALRGNKLIITWTTWPLQLAVWLFRPLSFLLNTVSAVLDKITGAPKRDEVSVDGILHLLQHAESHDVLSTSTSRGWCAASSVPPTPP
jgi:Mg2+/Co2+ transporter CorB